MSFCQLQLIEVHTNLMRPGLSEPAPGRVRLPSLVCFYATYLFPVSAPDTGHGRARCGPVSHLLIAASAMGFAWIVICSAVQFHVRFFFPFQIVLTKREKKERRTLFNLISLSGRFFFGSTGSRSIASNVESAPSITLKHPYQFKIQSGSEVRCR